LSVFEAVILGIIQGLTEFLPISSTGHLTLAGRFMNIVSEENPEQWTSFIAVIQLGTLAAILVYFFRDIINIITAFISNNLTRPRKFKEQELDSRLGWYIIAGTIPVVIVGLLFKDVIEGSLTKNLYVIAFSLIGLAILLAIAEKTAKHKKQIKDITLTDAFVVGIAQSFALIPGSSRSGTTITGGLFMGLSRETAARFSFLLSIPAIFASGALQLFESLEYLDGSMILNLVVATIFSAISGYAAIDFLLKYLRKNSTFVFIYYRIILGVFILVLLFFNIINP
jgi:undecaprenyl-diphosphatase